MMVYAENLSREPLVTFVKLEIFPHELGDFTVEKIMTFVSVTLFLTVEFNL